MYAPPTSWNQYFRKLHQVGDDLDWENQWTDAFIEPLQKANLKTVLDLGCGTGNDILRLIQAGFVVAGLDFSTEAIDQARAKTNSKTLLLNADMARTFPFPNASFDAVMSNVALHMFSYSVTRQIFAEVRRIVRPGGLFLFHVNALDDRPIRAKRIKPVREIEPDFILEETGQTVHFFSREYLLELLADWRILRLESVTILDEVTREPFKKVWRVIAQQPILERTALPTIANLLDERSR